MYIAGDCDWLTPCTSGVCFANSTGCPVTGVFLLNSNQTNLTLETGSDNVALEDDHQKHGRHHFIAVLIAILGIAFALLASCFVATIRR